MHPTTVVHLEHDGKVLLVGEDGTGPHLPIQGRIDANEGLRFPSPGEVQNLGIEFVEKGWTITQFADQSYKIIKGYPKIEWPKNGPGKMIALPIIQFTRLQGKQFTVQFIVWFQK